ncbi:MAG: ATP-binding protein [Gammaproteobacteria bacterium]
MVERKHYLSRLKTLIAQNRVVAIIGARQVGKTQLAKAYCESQKKEVHYYDLEDPEDLARLQDPMLALKPLKGLVVIDEVQRKKDLFPILRVLADRPRSPAKFLLLGSASPELIQHSSETLAGRIFYFEMSGFDVGEIGIRHYEKLWLRGGFPRSYLAKTNTQSFEWRNSFIKTFLEQDIPQLGIQTRAATLRRFWNMLAHYHGQTLNFSELGRAFGVSDTTIRYYLDQLSSALVVNQLLPWHENISKRQVKAPKVYISDSGILHSLLNVENKKDLEGHPKIGASWEGFVMNEVIRIMNARQENTYFWATHSGAELDLLIMKGRSRIGFEIKRTSSPKLTPSMKSAVTDLKLNKLYVVHGGEKAFSLDKKVQALPFEEVLNKKL